MDEDQLNEQEDSNKRRIESSEGRIEELEGRVTGSTNENKIQSQRIDQALSGVRRSLNLYNFLDKKQDISVERVERIERSLVVADRNIKSQSSTFNQTLVSINTSLLTVHQGLKVVSDKLEISEKLRKIRDANELKREQQLAQQQLREGKESLVEKKIQSALLAPVRRLGAKTRSILGSLLKVFNIALLGFMGMKSIQLLDALIKGDEKKLKEIKDEILKQLTIAGGIFIAINGGLAIALRSILRLTAFAGRIAVTNLLFRPIQAIINAARLGFFGGGNVPPPVNVPPGAGATTASTSGGVYRNGKLVLGSGKMMSQNLRGSMFVGSFGTFEALMRGEALPEAFGEGISRAIVYRLSQIAIGLGLAYFGVKAAVLYPTAFLGAAAIDMAFGSSYGETLGDFTGGVIRNITGMSPATDNLAAFTASKQMDLRAAAENNVVVVQEDDNTTTSSSGQVPDVSALMSMPSSNADNPYIANSFIQYNVVLL